jgi:hypothetical protein
LLVGYYEGRDLRFAGKVRAGLVPHVRRELLTKLKPLEIKECPFVNLPDAASSRWGGGVTAEQMSLRGTCRCRVQRDDLIRIRSFCRFASDCVSREDLKIRSDFAVRLWCTCSW